MEQLLACYRTMILLLETIFTPAKKMKGVDGAALGMPHRTMILLLETMFTPVKKMKGVDGAPQTNDFIIRNNVYSCLEDERC